MPIDNLCIIKYNRCKQEILLDFVCLCKLAMEEEWRKKLD